MDDYVLVPASHKFFPTIPAPLEPFFHPVPDHILHHLVVHLYPSALGAVGFTVSAIPPAARLVSVNLADGFHRACVLDPCARWVVDALAATPFPVVLEGQEVPVHEIFHLFAFQWLQQREAFVQGCEVPCCCQSLRTRAIRLVPVPFWRRRRVVLLRLLLLVSQHLLLFLVDILEDGELLVSLFHENLKEHTLEVLFQGVHRVAGNAKKLCGIIVPPVGSILIPQAC